MEVDPEQTRPFITSQNLHSVPSIAEAPAELSPKTISRYEITAKIGQGGFGEVFSAFDPELKRNVAIKLIRGLRSLLPREADGFQQEARVLASLDHPGIVPIYDFGFHEGAPYFVMKLVEGRSLVSVVSADDGLDEAEVLRLAVQISEAIAYAHRNGVLHRDIKPHNIMVGPNGQTTILDFGLALVLKELSKEKVSIMGTPGFMPPEVESVGRYSVQSDLYSFGVTIQFLLNGILDVPSRPTVVLVDPAASAREGSSASETPSLLDKLLSRLLEPDPSRRPKSADEVFALLKNLAALSSSFAEGGKQAKVPALPSGELLGLLTEEFLRACQSLTAKITSESASFESMSADFVNMIERGRTLLRPAGATARLRPEDRLCRTALENAHSMATYFEPELQRLAREGKIPTRFVEGLIAELRSTITKPAKKLLWLVDQIRGDPDSADVEEDTSKVALIAFDDCGFGRSTWREKLLSVSDLDRYEALLAIIGSEQAEFLITLPFLVDSEKHRVLNALWSQADLLLLEGRERARPIFEAACANAGEPALRDHWVKLFSFYRPAANRALLDPEMIQMILEASPASYRKVFARSLLVHPEAKVRAAARVSVEPNDHWFLIANRWTPLDMLLEVWLYLRGRTTEDFFKIFLFCVYDRLLGCGQQAQFDLALKFFRAMLEVKSFHERIYFQLITKIEKSLRSQARVLGVDLDYDSEYQQKMRAFASIPIAQDQPIHSWGHVPLAVQRMLARRGLFLRFFSCHPIDPIALECLRHLARREDIVDFLKLFAINARLLGSLSEERRLFESDAAKFHLLANPRCPLHIVARYLGFLTNESLVKLFEGREYNSFSRQQAERLLAQRGKLKRR